MPTPITRTLARLDLVGDVRGQIPAFEDRDVEKAAISSEVVRADADRIELRLSGAARVVAKAGSPAGVARGADAPKAVERGSDGAFLGRATHDSRTGRFVAFERVAMGSRWGATRYNLRDGDLGPAPMGVLFSLAGDAPADHVAPASMGEYGSGAPRRHPDERRPS